MGNPSPRLLTRMLEDNKKKQEEKQANADLFAKINYFGQSSDQIRARARATTAVSYQSDDGTMDGSLPNNLDELRELIRGKSFKDANNNLTNNDSTKTSSIQRNSQILKPSQIIQLNNQQNKDQQHQQSTEEPRRDSGRTKEPKIVLKRFGSSKAPSMDIITEDYAETDEDDEEDDENNNNDENDGNIDDDEEVDEEDENRNEGDERIRQESIRKFVQARFSGASASNSSNVSLPSKNQTIVPFSSSLSYSFESVDDNDNNNDNNNNLNDNDNNNNTTSTLSTIQYNNSGSNIEDNHNNKNKDNKDNNNNSNNALNKKSLINSREVKNQSGDYNNSKQNQNESNEHKLSRFPSLSSNNSHSPISTMYSSEFSMSTSEFDKLQNIQTPNPSPLSISTTPTPPFRKNRYSKRISMQCVHPKLLEKICFEWMDSVPWKVN